ncbi:mechanosensitive ion channel family protein [Aurantiacibacter xanthus]|uniref:Mechanosensitive ion channel family protein n=1 Tax=Aurantiacibacter xanthus TaxID=1784712 RepID=A0A3A1P6M2_9SPHN|nr:mechanosensitive ion channel family protein [Aurantiacibacter xanthus]RIV88455.1 mechanosensitive ion channel family protein [Aurantiacibacter xanthus]
MQQLADRVSVSWPQIGEALIYGSVGIAVALIVHWLIFGVLTRITRSSKSLSDGAIVSSLRSPSRWSMAALGLVLAARETPLLESAWEKIAGFVMPALIGWMALAIMRALVTSAEMHLDLDAADNLRARQRQTRLRILSRIGTFVVIFITVGLMLLSIPGVRDIGVTLMASAGLAALAVGAAAQPALKSLIAGVQMALTEPIRLGDAVIVGGEWGWIEDIRTTYVVVKVWDERRLVVPTSKFLDEIFQNWTKTTAQLLGTVYLYVDPATRLDPIRARFLELVESNQRWDGRVRHMQVTDLTRDAIEVRLLMTAKDSPTLYDLRCDIREALIQWLAAEMPEALVRSRVISVGADGQPLGAPSAEALAQMGGEG